MAGLAALPAALPVAAAEPDPVFAAIAKKRAADALHVEACRVLSGAEKQYGFSSDEAHAAFEDGGPACHAAYEAARSLMTAQPTTMAGVAAVLRFVVETENEGNWPDDTDLDRQLRATAATAIEAILRGRQ